MIIKRIFRSRFFKPAAILVLIAILIGAIYIFSPKDTKPSAVCKKATDTWDSSRQHDQILYVDGCFVPNPLNIKVGDSVIFTDHDKTPMWIISDDKPDKQHLGNFNSGQAWGEGQSYGYQFAKPGAYYYHNKERPNDKGVVIVK